MIATASDQRLGRLDIDLDHARIGRDLDNIHARVIRRCHSLRACTGIFEIPPRSPPRPQAARDNPKAHETGGMKTHSRPSRGSTPECRADRESRWHESHVGAVRLRQRRLAHRRPVRRSPAQGARGPAGTGRSAGAVRHAARTGRPARTAAAPRPAIAAAIRAAGEIRAANCPV